MMNERRDLRVILLMNHPTEGEAGELFKLFQRVAAEYVEDRFVGIQQFFAVIRFVDKKTAGYLFTELFNDGKALLI